MTIFYTKTCVYIKKNRDRNAATIIIQKFPNVQNIGDMFSLKNTNMFVCFPKFVELLLSTKNTDFYYCFLNEMFAKGSQQHWIKENCQIILIASIIMN